MTPVSPAAEPVSAICVFRALPLGEMICATPALQALRRHFPAAHITLVGLPWAADFAARMPRCIDEFVEFPGWPGLSACPLDVPRLSGFLSALRQRHFDLAVQMHDSGLLTNALVQAFGARRTIGWRPAAEPADAGSELQTWPYPEYLHEVHRNLQLVAHLGAPAGDDRVVFSVLPADHAELHSQHPDLARLPADRYVGIHPGVRNSAASWAPPCFARVADALAMDGWTIVLTGSAGERELARAVAKQMVRPSINAARDFSLGVQAALLARARLLVSGDKGLVHLSAGLRVPSVAVFLDSDPGRWAPLDGRWHIAVYNPAGVEPRAVIAAARCLLQRRDGTLLPA